jgi:transcriptional regulator with XRE-family HTH domain
VREKRKEHGWTQPFLAKKTGVGQRTISKIEGGKQYDFRTIDWRPLADALDIPHGYFQRLLDEGAVKIRADRQRLIQSGRRYVRRVNKKKRQHQPRV